ncbi:hypothetical protein QUA81_25430 [Microcoleus sp. F6_B4]
MKAESEVSITFAISIFSNEKFKADDNRLNYDSYEELGLICGKCRELIFFKQGTKRISHFSHFRDTGKDCPWRTESHSNTQSSDSYKREQSLQEFQTKFRGIIKQGIIKYRQISSTQLDTQIAEGKSLVSTYKIDIESWVRWFNLNRTQLENLANNLYQSNELVSERNQRILLNFLDYLCVPASEYILRYLLYYVFGLLDKEISLKKYLEEVPSKVIELMSYAEWEKEYQVAQESLTFNEFPGYTHPNLPAKPPKSATITERIEPKPIEYTLLQVVKAKVTEKEKVVNGQLVKVKTFKEVAKAKTDVLKATLTSSDLGRQLAFSFQRGGNEEDAKDPESRILATFTVAKKSDKNFELSFTYKTEFEALGAHTYKPLIIAFPGIEAISIADVFSQWLCTPEFFEHLKIMAYKGGYTPALVKMLVLYMSYQDVKTDALVQVGKFSKDMVIDINEIAKVFRANMQELKSDVPRMAKHYSADLMLTPVSDTPPSLEISGQQTETPQKLITSEASTETAESDIPEDNKEISQTLPDTAETSIEEEQDPAIEMT